ncbi:MAG TPA: hypothetical protein EYH58_04970 [Aquifex aeolicus]|nr:hypothetical protein [Aquifex aeolicus]
MILLFIFASLLISVFQAAVFTPIFGTLFLTPSLSFIFILFSSYFIREKALISAFLIGLFLDAITDSWGIITLLNVLFTYIYMLMTYTVFVRNLFVELFTILPAVVVIRKILLIFIVERRFLIDFTVKSLIFSLAIDLIFILILCKFVCKRINEKT